jgi:hypothetical protein
MPLTPPSESKSIVLRSTHILLVRVTDAREGAWAPSQPALKSRTVDLSLQVLQTLRGKVAPEPKGPVQVRITQSDYAGELMMRSLPGVWSPVQLAPGTELVVFARTDSSRVEDVLTEPGCTRVVLAKTVLPGVRIAVNAEGLSLERTLALAAPETTQLDPTFAEYLWEKHGGGALASQQDFDLLMGFTERKGLEVSTRQALLKGGYDLVGMHPDAPPERGQRLALTMCRVLLMPEASGLHENLIGTYLPNLLGITSTQPPLPAAAVFKGHEAERDTLHAFLRHHGTGADAMPLLTWINIK